MKRTLSELGSIMGFSSWVLNWLDLEVWNCDSERACSLLGVIAW